MPSIMIITHNIFSQTHWIQHLLSVPSLLPKYLSWSDTWDSFLSNWMLIFGAEIPYREWFRVNFFAKIKAERLYYLADAILVSNVLNATRILAIFAKEKPRIAAILGSGRCFLIVRTHITWSPNDFWIKMAVCVELRSWSPLFHHEYHTGEFGRICVP